jgi:hypothetical protein
MNEFLKYLEDMKKEKATPTRKKTGKVEGSQKELDLKTDLGELKGPKPKKSLRSITSFP